MKRFKPQNTPKTRNLIGKHFPYLRYIPWSRPSATLLVLLLCGLTIHAETLDDLLRTVETNNPAIRAAQHQWDAARERTILAGALPDPRISYGYYLEEVQTKTGPQQQKAGISQTFPILGKRGLRRDAAEHRAEALYARYRAVRAMILFDFKKSNVELYYLDRSIQTARTRKTLFQTLEKTVEHTVENGGDARDLLDLRITLTQIEDHLQTLQAKQIPLQNTLNALLNRDEQTPFFFIETLPIINELTDPEIRTLFRSHNPLLEEQLATLSRKQTQETLAGRNWIPNLTLGANWIQTGDGGEDPIVATLSMNLPIWHSKNRAERLNTEFERLAQTSRLQNQINTLHVLLTQQFSERNDAARRIVFYTAQLLPPAEQHVELTRTAYENGTTDLRELTASEERLLTLRLLLERSRTDRAIADAEIEKLTGGPSL